MMTWWYHRHGGRRPAKGLTALLAALAVLMICAAQAHAEPVSINVAGARPISAQARERIRNQSRKDISELNEFFAYNYGKPVKIFVAATQQEFAEAVGPDLPYWAAAIADGRRVFMGPRADSGTRNFASTLKHELCHVVLYDMFVRRPHALPRWLNEGLAVHVSGDWELSDDWAASKRDLYSSLRQGSIPDFSDIAGGFPASEWKARDAYAQSAFFVEYLYDRFGNERMNGLLKRLARGQKFDKAFHAATGRRFDRVEEHWRGRMHGKSAMGLFLLSLMHVDTLIWVFMALLIVIGFLRYVFKRYFRTSSDDDDDYDDDDDVDEFEYWDEHAMGHKPWRPGRD